MLSVFLEQTTGREDACLRTGKITLIQANLFFPFSKLCHRCGHKNDDLALHDRTWCCPGCGETHDRDINASINLYLVGVGRLEVKPVEQVWWMTVATTGYLKSHPATKLEAQLQEVEQCAMVKVFYVAYL